MEITGKIKMIEETKTYGNNGFRKREVVVTTEEQYPQHILVELSINLRGREWVNPQGETKYFNSITGWRIENAEQAVSQDMPPMPPADTFEPVNDLNEDDHDDLPF